MVAEVGIESTERGDVDEEGGESRGHRITHVPGRKNLRHGLVTYRRLRYQLKLRSLDFLADVTLQRFKFFLFVVLVLLILLNFLIFLFIYYSLSVILFTRYFLSFDLRLRFRLFLLLNHVLVGTFLGVFRIDVGFQQRCFISHFREQFLLP